ncbi:MAG: class I SAM-dependent methyltransferase [Vicinamibacterales bacterium]
MTTTPAPESSTRWADRASALYDEAYARRYRAHDEEFERSAPCRDFAAWLAQVRQSLPAPIDVLDLGCGTGRYFWALTGVRNLVGIDASPAMLAQARAPYNAARITATSVTLIQDDLVSHRFERAQFDLVYSIGVLAEHVPLDQDVVAAVASWLKPNGRFAFTTVHPASPSIPRTVGRRVGEWLAPVAPAGAGRRLRARLLAGGLYADERRVRELLVGAFDVVSIERFESEAHLHCLCVASRRGMA